jgi:hypothetical protein
MGGCHLVQILAEHRRITIVRDELAGVVSVDKEQSSWPPIFDNEQVGLVTSRQVVNQLVLTFVIFEFIFTIVSAGDCKPSFDKRLEKGAGLRPPIVYLLFHTTNFLFLRLWGDSLEIGGDFRPWSTFEEGDGSVQKPFHLRPFG